MNRGVRAREMLLQALTVTLVCSLLLSRAGAVFGQDGAAEVTEAQYKLSWDKAAHDFGKAIEGEKVCASFVIRNEGNATISIESVTASHRNAVPNCTAKVLEPGQEAEIALVVDTTGTRGKASYGIRVKTSDPNRPEILFLLSGEVEPLLEVSPPHVFIGQLAQDASSSGKARVTGHLIAQQAFSSLKIEYSAPGIEATLEPSIGRTGLEALLQYRLLPSFRAGTFNETIAVVSDGPPARAELRLLGQKLGAIRFEPDRLEYFSAFQDESRDFSRVIRLESDKEFHITEINDLSGLLHVTLIPVEEGRKYNLHVDLKERPDGSALGLLQIHTDLQENPLIDIPIIIGEQ